MTARIAGAPAPGEQRPRVAAFDVDGTLTVRDCVVPFLQRLGGRRGMLAAAARRPLDTLSGVARRDRDRVKDVFVGGVFRARRVADVAAIGTTFAQYVHDHWLRADVLARLRWHQRHGDPTVLVSASLGPYLRPLGGMLGVDDVLCTDVTTDGATYADRLVGGNCRGPEKARRLRSWLDTRGLAGAEVWAYGDSAGDRELLACADHPQLVAGVVIPEAPPGAQP